MIDLESTSLNEKCILANQILFDNGRVKSKFDSENVEYLLGMRSPKEWIQDRKLIKDIFGLSDLKFDFFGKYCLDIFWFEEELDNIIKGN